jgi:hypothetical protein
MNTAIIQQHHLPSRHPLPIQSCEHAVERQDDEGGDIRRDDYRHVYHKRNCKKLPFMPF